MANDIDLDAVEASWGKAFTIPSIVLDDAPLKEWMVRAHNIFAGETWENLDGIVCRVADAIPEGVTDENFPVSEPLAKVCSKWLSNVEKLRTGLNRPLLDLKKAIDSAAKETVNRALPTLQPIIDAVQAIKERRKAEKAAAEAAEAKRVEDERLAAEKAHRDMLEAEQAAERARVKAEQDAENVRLAAVAEANRIEAENLAAERKEMEEMKRWLAEREARVVSSEDAKKIVEAPDDGMVPIPASNDIALNERVSKRIDAAYVRDVQVVKTPHIFPFPKPSKRMTQAELDAISLDADTSAEFAKAGIHVRSADDQQKVHEVGNAIMAFKESIVRPNLIKGEARQALELALFDLNEIGKRLQEWRMP